MALAIRMRGETAHAGTIEIYDNIEVRGMGALDALLARLEHPQQAAGDALYAEAEDIMAVSEVQCPLDKGPLRAGRYVAKPVIVGTTVTVRMGYGGVAIPYALRQHEELGYHHPTPGTKAKYLEDPVREAESGFGQRIAMRLQGTLAA